MVSVNDLQQFKETKEQFEALIHSERAAIISFFTEIPMRESYTISLRGQTQLLFRLLYNMNKRDAVMEKIKILASGRQT